MIYGKFEGLEDKNISRLLKLMRLNRFLLFPSITGERQPIHASQLAKITKLLFKNMSSNIIQPFSGNYLTVGGDSTIKYIDMLRNQKINIQKFNFINQT